METEKNNPTHVRLIPPICNGCVWEKEYSIDYPCNCCKSGNRKKIADLNKMTPIDLADEVKEKIRHIQDLDDRITILEEVFIQMLNYTNISEDGREYLINRIKINKHGTL